MKDENCKTGKLLPVLLSQTIQVDSGKVNVTRKEAITGAIDAKIAAINQITVIGTKTGDARTISKSVFNRKWHSRAPITEAQKNQAQE